MGRFSDMKKLALEWTDKRIKLMNEILVRARAAAAAQAWAWRMSLSVYACFCMCVCMCACMCIYVRVCEMCVHVRVCSSFPRHPPPTTQQGIRVLKYFSWEESYAQRVEELRAEEMDRIRSQGYAHGTWTIARHSSCAAPFRIVYLMIDCYDSTIAIALQTVLIMHIIHMFSCLVSYTPH